MQCNVELPYRPSVCSDTETEIQYVGFWVLKQVVLALTTVPERDNDQCKYEKPYLWRFVS